MQILITKIALASLASGSSDLTSCFTVDRSRNSWKVMASTKYKAQWNTGTSCFLSCPRQAEGNQSPPETLWSPATLSTNLKNNNPQASSASSKIMLTKCFQWHSQRSSAGEENDTDSRTLQFKDHKPFIRSMIWRNSHLCMASSCGVCCHQTWAICCDNPPIFLSLWCQASQGKPSPQWKWWYRASTRIQNTNSFGKKTNQKRLWVKPS